MDKKRWVLILLTIIILIISIMFVIKANFSSEDDQDMKYLSSGGEGAYWFHLSGTVEEKSLDTLLVKLDESDDFFEDMEVSLDCSQCKTDFAKVSEGDSITFYFFKSNINGQTVKIEKIYY